MSSTRREAAYVEKLIRIGAAVVAPVPYYDADTAFL